MTFEPGNRVRIPHRPDLPGYVLIENAIPAGDVRSGSVKRVASAVGEGSRAVRLVHQYLADTDV